MDKVIARLDDMFNKGELSDICHGVLKRLAKKRKKERFWHMVRTCNLLFLLGLYLITLSTLWPALKAYQNYFNGFLNWFFISWHFYTIFSLIICHFSLKIVVDKYDEADQKYDRLRKEVLDREAEIWNRSVEDRLARPKVLSLFDEKKVNLYHK